MPSQFQSNVVPLLLKLTFTILTGAATLLSFRRLHRRHILSSLRLRLLSSLQNPDPNNPPLILVTGPRSHGKSALINTFCRVLADEKGPLIVRSETVPVGSSGARLDGYTVRAGVAADAEAEEVGGGVEEDGAEVAFVEGTGVGDGMAVDCVVVVVRCGVSVKERKVAVRWLGEAANVIRERGLHLVVVLTQKNALKSTKQAEKLRREAAYWGRTDCVYFIDNYTQNFRHPIFIKSDFDTQITALTIIRQCVEFARLHQSRLPGRDKRVQHPAINLS